MQQSKPAPVLRAKDSGYSIRRAHTGGAADLSSPQFEERIMKATNANVLAVVTSLKPPLQNVLLRKRDQTLVLRAISLCAVPAAHDQAMEVVKAISFGHMTFESGYRRINRLWSMHKQHPVLEGVQV